MARIRSYGKKHYGASPSDDVQEKFGIKKSVADEPFGVWFRISGKKIIAAIKKKCKALRVDIGGEACSKIAHEPLTYPEVDVVREDRTAGIKRRIERLERVARNLDPKKKYRLSDYDLQEYGL
jgi:hypothetical protein